MYLYYSKSLYEKKNYLIYSHQIANSWLHRWQKTKKPARGWINLEIGSSREVTVTPGLGRIKGEVVLSEPSGLGYPTSWNCQTQTEGTEARKSGLSLLNSYHLSQDMAESIQKAADIECRVIQSARISPKLSCGRGWTGTTGPGFTRLQHYTLQIQFFLNSFSNNFSITDSGEVLCTPFSALPQEGSCYYVVNIFLFYDVVFM